MQRINPGGTLLRHPPRVPRAGPPPEQPLGTEYTSNNTRQLESAADIKLLLDKMGEVEFYI
ncbi:MAG: hypothetical protein Ct9H300mP7_1630 [Verrucomicrobiota bacterium]|nr:MAG: hypothetical protein Ct9H300mP7_1630 [Verrucomicrobiota bacterium]